MPRSLSGHQLPVRGATDEWLTPPDWIAALGPFDLDPCAPADRPWSTARRHYTPADDGLTADWPSSCFVWLNPPFSSARAWLSRLADHGGGIALVAARTETRTFRDLIWGRADAILFVSGRPHFHRPDGSRAPFNSGAPICLVAYGHWASTRLARGSIAGSLVRDWRNLPE